jgi:hypothetical protein
MNQPRVTLNGGLNLECCGRYGPRSVSIVLNQAISHNASLLRFVA